MAAKLDTRIKFIDIRRDVPGIMSASDVFVFPSLWEGLGMVAVEAQCSGLKVIMSDSVPKEAVVAKSLVTIKELHEGAQAWAESIAVAKAITDRARYVNEIKESPFSIENSVNGLTRLYES
jgi:glycosyltransferase EpsF